MADRHRHVIEPLRPDSAFAYLRHPDGYVREPSGLLAVVDVDTAPVLARLLDDGVSLDSARAWLDATGDPLA